jgi:hypothetical protein
VELAQVFDFELCLVLMTMGVKRSGGRDVSVGKKHTLLPTLLPA